MSACSGILHKINIKKANNGNIDRIAIQAAAAALVPEYRLINTDWWAFIMTDEDWSSTQPPLLELLLQYTRVLISAAASSVAKCSACTSRQTQTDKHSTL